VREAGKILAGALVALALLAASAACGGGDSLASTAEVPTQPPQDAPNGASKQGGMGNSPSSTGKGGRERQPRGASEFVPKQHDDSGGGSGQYRIKGGDNSVQEFGSEAPASERESAATALHNYLDARAEANWAAACEYASKTMIESFKNLAEQAKVAYKSCGFILRKLTNLDARDVMKAEAERANVGSLRTDGERSYVIYKGIEGTIFAMPVEKEDGEWKISNLIGAPLN
jgi:hypothetical protein